MINILFSTKQIVFSKLLREDYSDLLGLEQNTAVRMYLGGPVLVNDFKKSFEQKLLLQEPELYIVLRDKSSTKFIGIFAITEYKGTGKYELSYEILPAFWGKGYAFEAGKRILEYVFKELEITKIYAETQEKNIASSNFLLKMGFIQSNSLVRFGERQGVYLLEKTIM